LTPRVSYASDRPWVVDMVFWKKKSLLAWPTKTQCLLQGAPLLPGGYPLSTSLYVSGENLGPAGPGRSVSLPYRRCCLVLDYLVQGAEWNFFRGCIGCRSPLFSRSAIVSILFLLCTFLLLSKHFFENFVGCILWLLH
jgi:hypothetical protein